MSPACLWSLSSGVPLTLAVILSYQYMRGNILLLVQRQITVKSSSRVAELLLLFQVEIVCAVYQTVWKVN